MARSNKTAQPAPARAAASSATVEGNSPAMRAFDAVFRFLASLKLAIISLSTLAVVLGAGTWFERSYGNKALQDYFYRTWWFTLLLGMLGVNILCAALIRFPWKKRQTGFVVTHAGLIVLLIGSWVSFQVGDAGQLGMVEGQTSSTMIRMDEQRIRVREIDAATGRPKGGDEYVFDFKPGAFNWPVERSEELTDGGQPFELKMKAFYPASAPRYVHEEAKDGAPMVGLDLEIQPAGGAVNKPFEQDILDRDRWLKGDSFFARRAKDQFGLVRTTFQQVESSRSPNAMADFLDLPEKGKVPVARVRYKDASGKDQVVKFFPAGPRWVVGDQTIEGNTLTLPGTDLDLTYQVSGQASDPAVMPRLRTSFRLPGRGDRAGSELRLVDFLVTVMESTGDEELPLIEFTAKRGAGPEQTLWTLPIANLPALCFEPDPATPGVLKPSEPPVDLSFFQPPSVVGSEAGQPGVRGVVDIVADEQGRLLFRTFNRDGLNASGELPKGKLVQALGGGPNQPMSMRVAVTDYLPSGVERLEYVPITMPPGKADSAIPAALAELKADGQTREVWLRGPTGLDPEYEKLAAGGRFFELAFDFDRKDLPFQLSLVDFRRRFDPGTPQASAYESDVLLTDDQQKIKDRKVKIEMNEPLVHRNYTFYQSSFTPPQAGDNSGKFISVFQVRYDPAWPIVYGGCLLVVIGTFLQFYMRAGVFTDGGKREREKAEIKRLNAAKKAAAKSGTPPVATPEPATATVADRPEVEDL